jgi:hypothetical protein
MEPFFTGLPPLLQFLCLTFLICAIAAVLFLLWALRRFVKQMSKPLQFSMRRLFLAVTLISLGLGTLLWMSAVSGNEFTTFAALALVGALFGSSLGVVLKHTLLFAVLGAILFPAGWFVYAVTAFFFFNPIRC